MSGKDKMVVRQTQTYTFLLLLLAALQSSCRTGPVAPTPQRASEAEQGKPAGKADAPIEPESTKIDKERSKDPKPSTAAKPYERLPESIVGAPGKELASPKIAYDTVLVERAAHASNP